MAKIDYFLETSLKLKVVDILKIMQNRIMTETTWFGQRAFKNPLDFWVYQEIIFIERPDVIIEIGNKFGGSTLALAHLCDLLNHGEVIGVDINHENISEVVRNHPRISLITGDACEVFEFVKARVNNKQKILIIEDSSHTYENTLNILRLYSTLSKKGSYLIVEDSICHHGLNIGPKPGPYEAVEQFIKENKSFIIDRTKETFLLTWNPKGFLLCVK